MTAPIEALLPLVVALVVALVRIGSELRPLGSLAALVLALVFLVAAAAKLRTPEATIRQLTGLELPAPATLAGVLPAAELVIAAALLLAPRLGAALALVALVAFTAVLVRTINRGLTVSCGCLGALDRGPVGWTTVIRNGVLVVLAVLAGLTPSLRMPDLPSVLVLIGLGTGAAVGGQLVAARQVLGRIWSVQLAGETGRKGPGRNWS